MRSSFSHVAERALINRRFGNHGRYLGLRSVAGYPREGSTLSRKRTGGSAWAVLPSYRLHTCICIFAKDVEDIVEDIGRSVEDVEDIL